MYSKILNKQQYSIYKYNEEFVLININNGKWWFFACEKDANDTLNAILNSNKTNSIISKMEKLGFFNELSKYSNPTLQFHLTNECNLRCTHCYMECNKKLDHELSFDEIKKILIDFKECGGDSVVYTGGEVVLKDNFVEIIEFTKKLGLFVEIITNGTLWNEELVNKIYPNVDIMQVSLDGYDESSNALIRGKGTFDKALKCIDMFLNKGKSVIVAFTPLYGYDKDKYINFCNNLIDKYSDKKIMIDFSPWLLNGRDLKNNVNKNDEYYFKSIDVLNKIIPGYGTGLFLNVFDNPIQNCGYGKLVLDSNGDFAFCSCLREIPKIGNIRDIKMSTIKKLSEKLTKVTMTNNIEPCNVCDFKYICGGSCRMVNFENASNISTEYQPKLKRYVKCSNEKFEFMLNLMKKAFEVKIKDVK